MRSLLLCGIFNRLYCKQSRKCDNIVYTGLSTQVICLYNGVKEMEHFQNIVKDVLLALYQYINGAVVLSVLFMFVYLAAEKRGWKQLVRDWIQNFKTQKHFRRVFFLAFYTAMILLRTVICRSYWTKPLQNVIGTWGIYDNNGNIYTEGIENIVLMLPFIFLLFWTFREKIFKKGFGFWIVICKSILTAFSFSALIEFCQLMFRLGTFQLSDIFFNTLGGLAGGIIYWLICRNYKN